MSANTLHLKPASGLLVRHPEPPMRALDAAGEHVPNSGYWQRRLRDGDCELVAPDGSQGNPQTAAEANPSNKDAGEA